MCLVQGLYWEPLLSSLSLDSFTFFFVITSISSFWVSIFILLSRALNSGWFLYRARSPRFRFTSCCRVLLKVLRLFSKSLKRLLEHMSRMSSQAEVKEGSSLNVGLRLILRPLGIISSSRYLERKRASISCWISFLRFLDRV